MASQLPSITRLNHPGPPIVADRYEGGAGALVTLHVELVPSWLLTTRSGRRQSVVGHPRRSLDTEWVGGRGVMGADKGQQLGQSI